MELAVAQHPCFTHGPQRTSVSKLLIVLDKCTLSLKSSNIGLENTPFDICLSSLRERKYVNQSSL